MGRRGHGEGSIHQRKDGYWTAVVDLGWEDGKRKRKQLYAKTRKEVANKLAEAQRLHAQGVALLPERETVSDFLERWLRDAVKPSVRPRTYDSYALNVRRVTPHLGRLKLAKAGPSQVQACYGALLADGLSRRSVEQVHTVLHRAFRQAVQWRMIPHNPTDAVAVPRPSRREMATLNRQQAEQLVERTRDDRLHALWVLLVTTGLRLGEATGLVWDDIRLSERSLTVRRALQRQRGVGLCLVEPKTARSRRKVHVAAGTIAALREHRRRQAEERLKAGPAWRDQGLVFPNTIGAPIDPARVNESFHRALEAAELPRIRVHDLRHTAATLLLAQGIHAKVVQELLGHSTITLTLDTYSHVIPAMHAEVATSMDTLFPAPAVNE